MNWIARLFCRHQWITKFRGQYTRGVECSVCGKTDLLCEPNDDLNPVGWIEDN